ncbi:MAG TPA: nickel pincer cofactor biosynthesis protein LarC [Candidatus Saccharicenans sp.]|nr:nickel pincer cofactor biosynthesis protein LarC [Candidatus Saccharicenans sp.]
MKYVYFDCSSGASGDMILASLLSLGVPVEEFQQAIQGLKLPVEIKVSRGKSHGLAGTRVEVITSGQSSPRNFEQVSKVINRSRLEAELKAKAIQIFRRLFQAESRVHGLGFARAHLHEAAADDALVDITGSCWLLQRLEVDRVYFSPVNLGRGSIKTSHGLLPVPAPAVAELMKGYPVYSSDEQTELLTPTGAAILTTLGECWTEWPQLIYDRVGHGLGQKELQWQPNVLRSFYGELKSSKLPATVFQIEATIDDSSPQVLGHFLDKALNSGALETYLTPVVMKKSRLGTKLTVLVEADKIETLIEAIFRETTTIGLRYFPVARRTLQRTITEVRLGSHRIRIKEAFLGEERINIQPEYEDCRRAAEALNLPLKKVILLSLEKIIKRGSHDSQQNK